MNKRAEKDYLDTIAMLSLISMIKPGDKFDTDNYAIVPNHIISSITRTIQRTQSRTNTLDFIIQTIDHSIELYCEYVSSSNTGEYADLIRTHIDKAIIGIENLSNTYSDDLEFVSRTNTYIAMLKIKISQFDDK
jgi:hypothetical protein